MTWYKIQRTTIIGNALEVNIHLIVHVLCTKFDVVTIQSKLLVQIQVNKCFLYFAYFDFTKSFNDTPQSKQHKTLTFF